MLRILREDADTSQGGASDGRANRRGRLLAALVPPPSAGRPPGDRRSPVPPPHRCPGSSRHQPSSDLIWGRRLAYRSCGISSAIQVHIIPRRPERQRWKITEPPLPQCQYNLPPMVHLMVCQIADPIPPGDAIHRAIGLALLKGHPQPPAILGLEETHEPIAEPQQVIPAASGLRLHSEDDATVPPEDAPTLSPTARGGAYQGDDPT